MVKVSIDMKRLEKSLNELPKNIYKNVMVGAVRAATRPIIEDARRYVPQDTGNLAASIKAVRLRVEQGTIKFSVTPGRKDQLPLMMDVSYHEKIDILKSTKDAGGFYGHMIEYGTEKMVAQPFMRPAYENGFVPALIEATNYIEKRLPQEVAKVRR